MKDVKYDDPVKSPVIQEIIISNRIGAISVELAKRLNIEPANIFSFSVIVLLLSYLSSYLPCSKYRSTSQFGW